MTGGRKIKETAAILAELGKFRITFFVAFTTAIGYILESGSAGMGMLLVSLGVFFLASGSSALNHYQERIPDSKMDRTKGRPLPSGKASDVFVIMYSILLSVGGGLIIFLSSGTGALLLGLLAFVW